MRKVNVILGIIVIILSLFLIIPLNEACITARDKTREMNLQITGMRKQMNGLEKIGEGKLLKSPEYYSQFITRFKKDTDTYVFKAQLEIVSADDNADKNIKERFVGINHIQLNCIFFQVSSQDEIQRIFEYIEKWPKQYPFVLDSIEYKNNQIHVMGGLYGL